MGSHAARLDARRCDVAFATRPASCALVPAASIASRSITVVGAIAPARAG
jgi:hypothetical protein